MRGRWATRGNLSVRNLSLSVTVTVTFLPSFGATPSDSMQPTHYRGNRSHGLIT